MKIKKSDATQIWKLSIAYVFIVLYFQLTELFLSFSITKVFLLLFIVCVLSGIITKKIKTNLFTYIIVFICAIYLIYYLLIDFEHFNNYYPILIVLCISAIFFDNVSSVREKISFTSLNKLIFVYAFLNILCYILKLQNAFQDNGIQLQYKGALPHSNLFGGVVISLFVLIFWDNSKKSIINKILLSILIFGTFSRTYILLIIALWLIWFVTFWGRKLNIWLRVIIEIVIVALCGIPLFSSMVGKFSFLARFSNGILSNLNGRNILQLYYYKALEDASWAERITGFNLARRYTDLWSIDFKHSFTENSYMALLILMGCVGLVLLFLIIYRLLKNCSNIQTVTIIIVMLVSLSMQDTLLSTQSGVLFFFSLIVMKETVPSSLKKYNFYKGKKYGQTA